MKNSANPMNHTACYKLELKETKPVDNSRIPFVCPHTKAHL